MLILKSFSLISTKTGVASVESIAATVAVAVCVVVITSSPFPISKALKDNSIASVPLLTPIQYFLPI